jgi:Nodulation protein Z (NodZ)
MTEGLFGQVILFIFEIIPILEKEGIDISTLHWDISTTNYGSIFPNVLEYRAEKSKDGPSAFQNIRNLFDVRRQVPQYVLGDDFERLNQLFFKYFRIPDALEQLANSYQLDGFLGLHFRGTDKTTDSGMNAPISTANFYTIVDSYIRCNGITRIFLATDENTVLTYFKEKYPDILFLSSRDFSQPLYWKGQADVEKNARDAMVDMLCLSKCDTVIKVSSALSSFAKLLNPSLKIYRVNALKMFTDIPYFPDAYIPLLTPREEFGEECNELLNRLQELEWRKSHGHLFTPFFIKER